MVGMRGIADWWWHQGNLMELWVWYDALDLQLLRGKFNFLVCYRDFTVGFDGCDFGKRLRFLVMFSLV